jgi:hypothetical protein
MNPRKIDIQTKRKNNRWSRTSGSLCGFVISTHARFPLARFDVLGGAVCRKLTGDVQQFLGTAANLLAVRKGAAAGNLAGKGWFVWVDLLARTTAG